MELDHNNSVSTNPVDDDSHIAPVTTTGSTNLEAFCVENPFRDNPSRLLGVPVSCPARVCVSGYVGLRYGNDPGPGFGGWVQNVQPSVCGARATFVNAPAVVTTPIVSTVRYSGGLEVGNRVGGSNWDQANNAGGDNSVSWKKVKLWCIYGGKIMPRPPDWELRYVGGDSKVVSVRRNVRLNELVRKIADSCGEFFVMKYQMPEEGRIESLVSVESTDDLENMMNEYDKIVEKSSVGIPKLKVFLFSPLQIDSSAAVQMRGFQENDQRYIEEVKETVDGNGVSITRTESMANASFMQNSDLSGTEAIDSTEHEKVEEVKGIVDGNGGGITRKESMASVTSMQNSELNGAVAIDSTGHERVDIEEVKGIVDGNGGHITRRDSMASATSMQISDLSKTETIDSTMHEQVDIEEVKGIVDGNGGGITTAESMASATPMQNSVLTMTEAIDSTRLEQVDIEEVKGIIDGNGGNITRRESMASATSIQKSDLYGTEAIDSTGHGQGDIAGTTSSGGVSSENNFTASQENAHRLVGLDHSPQMHVEPAADPLGIQAVSSHPIVLSTQPIPVVQIQQQQQAGLPPCAPFFQAYADPRQQVLSRTEYAQYPSQIGFPSQPLETVEPVSTQRQKHDNVASVAPNQFIPVVHMPMTHNSYANPRPTAVQPASQPQHVRLEHFQEENMFGQRLVQISDGWHQAPQIEQVPLSDGFRRQVALNEDVPRLEEGYAHNCKKALLRTHSETLAQGQRESSTTTSNFTPFYHRHQPGDKIRGQPVCTAALTATLAEGIIKNQVTEAPPTSLGYLEHEGRKPEYGEVVISQYVDDRTSQKEKDHNHLQALVPQCVVGGSQSPNSVFMATTPQLYQENVSQKPGVTMQHKAKEEVSYSTTVSAASVVDTSSQVSYHLFNSSSKELSGKLSGSVSREVTLEPFLPYDQLKQIDSRMENLGVRPSEVALGNEQLISPAGNSKQDDIIDNKAYQISNREPHIDSVVFMGIAPQLYQENISQKPVVLMQPKANEDTSSQVSDSLVHKSSKEHSGKLHSFVSKEGIVEPFLTYDHVKQIDGKVEDLGVHPSEVVLSNELVRSSAGASKQEDIMDNRSYQIFNREPLMDNVVLMETALQLYQENVSQKLVVPIQHKPKEEGFYSTTVSVASVEDTCSEVSDQLVHDSSKEQSGNLPGFVSKEGMLEPSIACDQLKKIDNRIENSGVRPSEVLDNEHIMSPDGTSKQKDIMDNRAYQIANRETYMDNAMPQMVGAKYCEQNEVPYCPSNEVPYSHNEVPYSNEVTQPPLLGNTEYPLERFRINYQLTDHTYYGNPTAFSGIDPAQVAKRSPPIGELKHNASQYYPKINGGVEALHKDGNNYYISPVNEDGDMQDNSNSLLSSEDPQNLQHDTHIPPPRQNEILTRNEAHSRDSFGGNRFGSSGEPATGDIGDFTSELLTEDGVHLPSGNLDADYNIRFGKEEHIKQELHNVAEGVAASVLQTCIPLGSAPQDSKFQSNDEVLHENKAEDMKSELSERANLGFPVSDGLGRLQIIKNSDLEELRELGSGTMGTVYYGKWRGSDVAIKRINDRCFTGKPSEQERRRDDFWNEAIKLADLHHPNVVAFYGVALDGPDNSVATVTEYMINGSLRTVLQKNEKNLDMQKRLLIAKEVAFGMEYLHGKNIVHFDLKSDNLLVNLLNPDRPVCKVGDLGLSKVKHKTPISGGVRGTLPWMAPERLNGRSDLVSEKVDVFSFGIVLWELLTGEEPYRDLHDGTIIGGIVSNTLRPPVPDFCDPEWRSLMERCWSMDPSERPNFTEVVNQLQTMEAKFPPKVQAEQQPQVKT